MLSVSMNELWKFSGKWFGSDGGVPEHVLVVEKVIDNNNAEGRLIKIKTRQSHANMDDCLIFS